MKLQNPHSREFYIDCIIDNLLGINNKSLSEKDYIMLGGNTGVGKTSLILFLEELLNIKVLLIEASHLSEEHLIDIPFIKKEKNDYIVKNSTPFLLSQLKYNSNIKPFSEINYINNINRNLELKKYYNLYKEEIKTIQQNYTSILFIDEFYRMPNIRISNLLRTILNGYIGTHKIPQNTYMIFASNFDFNDEGLHNIPFNHQFTFLNIEKSNNEDYKNYLFNKHSFENKTKELINGLLDLNILGYKNEEISISPRKFEEISIYINQNINNKDIIYNYLKLSFQNYKTLKISDKWIEVYNFLIDFYATKTFKTFSWKDILYNQITTQEKLNNKRKYSFALTGTYGVSKTSFIRQICKQENYNLIEIDVSTLNSDDVIGLPLSKENDNNLETFFSEPSLYKRILSQYKKINNGKNFTNILFLDEITRTDDSVFNAIRRMLLNKEINETYKLPEDILIISALNPNGIGTNSLTPHLIDVIDFIPVDLKKNDLISYLKEKEQSVNFNKKYNFDIIDISFGLLDLIFDKFKCIETEVHLKDFTLEIEQEHIYISPREIDSIISNFIIKTNKTLSKIDFFSDLKDEEYTNIYYSIANNFYISFLKSFNFILNKYRIENSNEIIHFIQKLLENKSTSILENIKFIKSKNIISFKTLMNNNNNDYNILLEEDCSIIINQYISTLENDSILIQELTDFINETLINEKKYTKEDLNKINILYHFFNNLDYSNFNNQITNRISEVFKIMWKTITHNIVYEIENQELLLEILNSDLLNTTFKEWFLDETNNLTDNPLFLIKQKG